MSQPPDDLTRPPSSDRDRSYSEAQRSGYVPRVSRPAGGPGAAPLPDVPPPWEDQPTAQIPVQRQQTAAPPRPPAQPPPPATAAAYIPAQAPRGPAPGYEPLPPAQPVEAPPREQRPVYDPTRAHIAPAVGAPRRRRGAALLGALAGLIVLALIGIFAAAGWYEQQYAGHMFPGIRVLGVDIGGKTREEAQVLLQNKVADFTSQPVALAWNDQQWTPQPEQLGMQVNLDRTLDNAYNVGRDSSLINAWRERWDVANEGRVVPLSVSLDESKLQAYLESQVAPKIDQALQEGDVWLQGEQVHEDRLARGPPARHLPGGRGHS